MNKYEQLIDAILSENQNRAKELFHQIVVERSRDIYESLMDDEDTEELSDEVEADEIGEGFEITAEEAKALMDYVDSGLQESVDSGLLERVADYYGVDVNEGLVSVIEANSDQLLDIAYGGDDADDMGDDMEPMDSDEGDMEDDHHADMGGNDALETKVMDLESALDELKAEFDALMAGEADEPEHDDMFGGDEEADMGDEEADMDDEEDDEEADMGDEEADMDDEEEEPKMESRSRDSVDIMREYVEKVSAGHGAEKKGAGEGHEVGTGGSVAVNKQSTVAKKNDMGGTAANLVKGGTEATPDGNSPKGKAGGFLKSPQEHDVAKRQVNKVGGNKGAENFYSDRAKARHGEESGVNKTSIESGKK
jgi:hypothetical protein